MSYDEKDPRDNPQDIPEAFLALITMEQRKYLLKLLKEDEAVNGLSDTTEEIYDSLNRWMLNPFVSGFLFINVYERDQQYGGPEEGGWYYHNRSCLFSIGQDVVMSEVDDVNLVFGPVADKFEEYCLAYGIEITWDRQAIMDQIESTDSFWASNLDKYGEGIELAIERLPGQSIDTARHFYE